MEAAYLDAGGEFRVGVRDGAPATAGGPGGGEAVCEPRRTRVASGFQGRSFGTRALHSLAVLHSLEGEAREGCFRRAVPNTAIRQGPAFYRVRGSDEVGRERSNGFELVNSEKEL